MKLTQQDIEEFQKIWKEVFKEGITPAFARDRGNALIELYMLMGKLTEPRDPDPQEPSASSLSPSGSPER